MPFLLTESAFAFQTGPVAEGVILGESAVATQIISAGDSAGLVEASSPFSGKAIVASDSGILTEPSTIAFGLSETETPGIAEALSSILSVIGVEPFNIAEAQTAKTSAAQVVTSSEQGLLAETPVALLATNAADQAAVTEAIRALLASLDTEAGLLGEIPNPSFGVPSLAGLAIGLASIDPDLVGASGIDGNLIGTANII